MGTGSWLRLMAVAITVAAVFDGCAGGPSEPPDEGGGAAPPDAEELLDEDRGQPPAELIVEDLAPGDGAPVTRGARVELHVGAVRWSDGRVVTWTWSVGQPYRTVVGDGREIAGFERGILQMREGGRRRITVPPDLAYGEDGAGIEVGADETLVFVVDLLEVDPEPAEDDGPADGQVGDLP
ncbi:MAG: FKBP-type peptidyl-prolyl cis-trans isomerase [Actinomycetota bacterium]